MYRELAQPFLKLGSCSLHPVHSAFQRRIKQLFRGQVPSATSNSEGSGELPKRKGTFDLDDLFTDIHSVFGLCSAGRGDCTSLGSVAGVFAWCSGWRVGFLWGVWLSAAWGGGRA